MKTLTEINHERHTLKKGDKMIYFVGVQFDDPKPKKITFSHYEPFRESVNLNAVIDNKGDNYCSSYLFKSKQDIKDYYSRDIDNEINYLKEKKIKIKNAVKNI